ncbi:MAG: hypothetical protein H6712_34750 [Myxococcales bacterium]|nr:hypothetical protein [Myxococcales bacterium]MCB9719057.1 hypothetical protein [Myxococcales bacterium]
MTVLRYGAGTLLAMAAGLGACEDEPDPPPEDPIPVDLIQYDRWTRVAEVERDVFGAERPADAVCDEEGLLIESFGPDPVFEIQTDLCNYATIEQPTLVELRSGDTVSLRLWYYDLTAPSPAEAHLALAIDGQVEWEQLVPVPAPATLLDEDLVIERELPAGVPLQFHVHNHGFNSYELISIEATPTGARE